MRHIALSIFLSLVSGFCFCQEDNIDVLLAGPDMQVHQTTAKMGKTPQPAFTVYLSSETSLAEKEWKGFLTQRYNCELKKNKKVFEALNIRMLDVADGSVNMFSKVTEDEGGCRLDVFVQSGSRFMEDATFPKESANLRKVMDAFARQLYVTVYDEALGDERKGLDKATKEMEKLAKTDEKLTKSIASTESGIAKAGNDITEAEQEIAALQIKIEELKLKVETGRNELDNLRSEQAKIQSDHGEKTREVSQLTDRLNRLKTKADGLRLR